MHPKIFSTKKIAAFLERKLLEAGGVGNHRGMVLETVFGSFVVGENWKLSQSHDSQWFFHGPFKE